MAFDFYAVKNNGHLVPATAADAEAMDGMTAKTTYRVKCTTTRPRSLQQHRLLFALIRIIRENTLVEPPLSTRAILQVLKLRSGHVDVVKLPSGEMILFPSSIAFEALSQDLFSKWFDLAIDIMTRDFLPGLTSEQARREIEAIAEDKPR